MKKIFSLIKYFIFIYKGKIKYFILCFNSLKKKKKYYYYFVFIGGYNNYLEYIILHLIVHFIFIFIYLFLFIYYKLSLSKSKHLFSF